MTGAEFDSTKKLSAVIGTEFLSIVLLLPHTKGSRRKGCTPSFQEKHAAKRIRSTLSSTGIQNTGVFLHICGPKYSRGLLDQR